MEDVLAIGCPGQYESTMTRGIVSYVGSREGTNQTIQHDAAINPGNSGGPLIRLDTIFIISVNAKFITWLVNLA